jgi:hypothetical protein
MEKDWVKLYKATDQFQAKLLQGMLKENSIDSVVINQKDSSYLSFGDCILYVHKDNYEKARKLVTETEE